MPSATNLEVIFNCSTPPSDAIWATPLPGPKQSLWVVNLAFKGDLLKKKGFGYLIPTKERESVLGAIFDSSIFPEQTPLNHTQITVMLRSSEKEPLKASLNAFKKTSTNR